MPDALEQAKDHLTQSLDLLLRAAEDLDGPDHRATILCIMAKGMAAGALNLVEKL